MTTSNHCLLITILALTRTPSYVHADSLRSRTHVTRRLITWDPHKCIYKCKIKGCTDPLAVNYDPSVQMDNGSCLYTAHCMNTEGTALDAIQYPCWTYWGFEDECGMDDDDDFSAREMCCACGGGSQQMCMAMGYANEELNLESLRGNDGNLKSSCEECSDILNTKPQDTSKNCTPLDCEKKKPTSKRKKCKKFDQKRRKKCKKLKKKNARLQDRKEECYERFAKLRPVNE